MSLFIQLTCAIAMFAVALPAAEVAQAQASVQGDWTLNRELTPAAPNGDDEARRPEGRRRPEGGFPAGGGGRRGRSGNGPGGARGGPSEKEMRKLRAVSSRIAEAPQRLEIAATPGQGRPSHASTTPPTIDLSSRFSARGLGAGAPGWYGNWYGDNKAHHHH